MASAITAAHARTSPTRRRTLKDVSTEADRLQDIGHGAALSPGVRFCGGCGAKQEA